MRPHTAIVRLDDLTFLDHPREPDAPAPAPDRWDGAAALALMRATDDAVAASGVSGTDEWIRLGANQCVRAHGRRDFASLTAACRLIRARVNQLQHEGKSNHD